jgi:hypothetical protein
MDVESKQTIAESIAAAHTAGDEVVDRAAKALAAAMAPQIAQLLNGVANSASTLLAAVERVTTNAGVELSEIIGQLDGWTLEIAPITIRLSRPKAK